MIKLARSIVSGLLSGSWYAISVALNTLLRIRYSSKPTSIMEGSAVNVEEFKSLKAGDLVGFKYRFHGVMITVYPSVIYQVAYRYNQSHTPVTAFYPIGSKSISDCFHIQSSSSKLIGYMYLIKAVR